MPLITLSPEHVRFAEDRSAVPGRIGATIRWIDEDESTSRGVKTLLTVVIATRKRSREAQRGSSTRSGIANPSVSSRAHLLDRVAALNVGTARTIPSLLGDVMAYQLGHLVCAHRAILLDGVMRAELETRSWALRTFTATQPREVLSKLQELRSGDLGPTPLPRSSRPKLP